MSAGITSVIGAAFTSVSFLKTLHPFIAANEKWFIVGFISISTLIMVVLGGAAKLLIAAGALNGLILPVTLGTMLLASRNKKIVGEDYHHPTFLIVIGIIVVLLTGFRRHQGGSQPCSNCLHNLFDSGLLSGRLPPDAAAQHPHTGLGAAELRRFLRRCRDRMKPAVKGPG